MTTSTMPVTSEITSDLELLNYSTPNTKIPRFKRAQSFKVKGEKTGNRAGNASPAQHMKLTLDNLRSFDKGGSHHRTTRAPLRSSVSLTKMHEDTDKVIASKSVSPKKLLTSSDRKLSLPIQDASYSEFVSLPPTPTPDIDDSDSVKSFHSVCSVVSLDAYNINCNQAMHRKKYVVHCESNHNGEQEYLTPTQRKERQIRQLKTMLLKARREIDDKNAEILHLTKELIDLRLFKTETEKSTDQPKIPTITDEAKDESLNKSDSIADIPLSSPAPLLMSTSGTSSDSGHCDHSDSGSVVCRDEATNRDANKWKDKSNIAAVGTIAGDACDLYRRHIEELKSQHSNEYQELKEKYNDRIENLLQKLSEANTRYSDIRLLYDRALDRERELEKQLESIQLDSDSKDERHKQMYLKMYRKGQEAARFEHADEVLEFAHKAPNRVSVPELLQQLHAKEHELEYVKDLYRKEVYKPSEKHDKDVEVTLKFLKDAIYYFLTDKENKGHLKAIESIMGYNESERMNIQRSMLSKNKLI